MSDFHANYYGTNDEKKRNDHDHYPTPPYVTYALRRHVSMNGMRVLEPAAGRGWMARELFSMGAHVDAQDLHEYEAPLFPVKASVDFLGFGGVSEYDAVITNPPYGRGLAESFVRKAVEGGASVVAMLMRLTFMESQGRLKLFVEHPPAMILPFSKRFSCNEEYFETDPFGGMVAYAWYVWKKGEINTTVKWIDSQAEYDEWRRVRESENITNA